MIGLIKYLAGPGRSNEHTDMRVITASDAIVTVAHGEALNAENTIALAHEMDLPKAVFGTNFKTSHVFHVSLSLAADEGGIPDGKWAAIAHDFAKEMGFNGDDGYAPCRWVAVNHGVSEKGNHHIHLAVSMIREDGTRWSQHKDLPRVHTACKNLEETHGLRLTYGQHSERGYHPKEREVAKTQGLAELPRETLQRAIRAASTASLDEGEFVRRLRGTGLLVRPRFADGGKDAIVGYSVAMKPRTRAEKPVWYGGGKLAKDLTLPKLRIGWNTGPDESAAAIAEWQAVADGKRMTIAGRETREPTADQWQKYTAEVGELYERIKSAPVDNPAMWAQVARETSGAFAAWSMRTEATPGPLAETAKALSRTAQLRRFPPQVEHAPLPSAKGAGMLLMQSSVGPSTTAGHALLLAQLRNTMKAIHDMHHANNAYGDAERIRFAAMDRLATVKASLGTRPGSLQELPAGTVSATPATVSAPGAVLDAPPTDMSSGPPERAAEGPGDRQLREMQQLLATAFPVRPLSGRSGKAAEPGKNPGGAEGRGKGRGR